MLIYNSVTLSTYACNCVHTTKTNNQIQVEHRRSIYTRVYTPDSYIKDKKADFQMFLSRLRVALVRITEIKGVTDLVGI